MNLDQCAQVGNRCAPVARIEMLGLNIKIDWTQGKLPRPKSQIQSSTFLLAFATGLLLAFASSVAAQQMHEDADVAVFLIDGAVLTEEADRDLVGELIKSRKGKHKTAMIELNGSGPIFSPPGRFDSQLARLMRQMRQGTNHPPRLKHVDKQVADVMKRLYSDLNELNVPRPFSVNIFVVSDAFWIEVNPGNYADSSKYGMTDVCIAANLDPDVADPMADWDAKTMIVTADGEPLGVTTLRAIATVGHFWEDGSSNEFVGMSNINCADDTVSIDLGKFDPDTGICETVDFKRMSRDLTCPEQTVASTGPGVTQSPSGTQLPTGTTPSVSGQQPAGSVGGQQQGSGSTGPGQQAAAQTNSGASQPANQTQSTGQAPASTQPSGTASGSVPIGPVFDANILQRGNDGGVSGLIFVSEIRRAGVNAPEALSIEGDFSKPAARLSFSVEADGKTLPLGSTEQSWPNFAGLPPGPAELSAIIVAGPQCLPGRRVEFELVVTAKQPGQNAPVERNVRLAFTLRDCDPVRPDFIPIMEFENP